MTSNRIITPEVILQKLSDRLREKSDDLEYLIYAERGFEKWLQCELILSFSDIAIPVVFNEDYDEITDKAKDGYSQKICDIGTEYSINGIKNLRSDCFIAEEPFCLDYVDAENWVLIEPRFKEKCIEAYRNTKYHYIELKQNHWIEINNTNSIVTKIKNDIEKYNELDWRNFKPVYRPSSIISISCISFQKRMNLNLSRNDIRQAMADVQKGCEKIDKSGYSLWQSITSEICLFMFCITA